MRRRNGREAWITEMKSGINALIGLGAFERGFLESTLPPGVSIDDVISSIWVFDVKVDGRKRTRLAARGDMEKHEDNSNDERHSPVV